MAEVEISPVLGLVEASAPSKESKTACVQAVALLE